MSRRAAHQAPAAPRLATGPAPRHSYLRLMVADSMIGLGVITFVCGIAGLFDDRGDAIVLLAMGIVVASAGSVGRRSLLRVLRPSPARILSGITVGWLTLVAAGTVVYLVTGTIERIDDAFVESAAGFSTTAVTTLDPEALSLPMQLWRAATQWMGGFFGIVVAAVALPLALRGSGLISGDSHERLAPTALLGRRRIIAIYTSLTVATGLAFLITGLGARDSVVHALTTISTGGFSSRADSFVGFGTGPRIVAVLAMFIGGSSYFLVWWLVRGRIAPVWRSTELRLYVVLVAIGTTAVAVGDETGGILGPLFTSVSAVSTTGHAVGDWTVLDPSVLMVLLLLIGTGSMSASAGAGLRVVRALTLVEFAKREMRRQLDPSAVIVIKQGGRAVDDRALERTTGYQISHLGLCGLAAFLLAASGVDVTGAIYTGISVLSTHGPGVGTGPFGSLEDISAPGRLFLVPFMLAGRLTILPLLLAVAGSLRLATALERRTRRLVRGGRR